MGSGIIFLSEALGLDRIMLCIHFWPTPMRTDIPQTISRLDYSPPAYLVHTVEMGFDLDPSQTRVATRLTMSRNPAAKGKGKDKEIVLDGEQQKLVCLRMNGKVLGKKEYQLDGKVLRIPDAPKEVVLEIETLTEPEKNTSLTGLYVSNGNFFTQCEAEGFRRITYFPDRPDVMAKFTVMLRADKVRYPVLLSNGNLIEEGDLGDGRHYAKWEDPFNKPSYLFALVAAQLVCQEEKFTLASGREVLLQVWVEAGNLDKTQHAMDSLKNSIRWDEARYGLELDLDRFMIVATSDFNMGAMENKGLNIFNTKFVLANPNLATDVDYAGIEAVVGHEYFHNWTGNRVTCRDWFQLSLKEGLTVFRDQEFSADMVGTDSGRAMCRIGNVRLLRQIQFAEDAGSMAHPVRPDTYAEINNFYTPTVYNKGSEVVRMIQTLVGRDGFRKGMDLYFQRHDGQAVACDDFRAAMADANGRDLKQFERWYSQAGTPQVGASGRYDAASQTYELTLTQKCLPSPGQAKKQPFHIPVAVGLLDAQGKDMPLYLDGADVCSGNTVVLELVKAKQTFRFAQVGQAPVPSLLRDFSAPVILNYPYTDVELFHLFAHDSDPFNRWEAGQRLMMQRLLQLVLSVQKGSAMVLDTDMIEAVRCILNDQTLDPGYRELVLVLPAEAVIAEQMVAADPAAIHLARQFMRQSLGRVLKNDWLAAYHAHLTPGNYSPDAVSSSRRSLKNLALHYLCAAADTDILALVETQLNGANNMTDRLAALNALVNLQLSGDDAKLAKAVAKSKDKALKAFYKTFQKEALAVDKWFALQASSCTTDVAGLRKLIEHPAFTLKNPNRVYNSIMAFCKSNPASFHAPDGSGYALWAEYVIQLNALNPQVASRVARSMDRWRNYAPALQVKMEQALKQVAKSKKLSGDVQEIISKALAVAA
jgi:aminopeptidase N